MKERELHSLFMLSEDSITRLLKRNYPNQTEQCSLCGEQRVVRQREKKSTFNNVGKVACRVSWLHGL
jgi:hypothetical protein